MSERQVDLGAARQDGDWSFSGEDATIRGWCRALFPGHRPTCGIFVDGHNVATLTPFIHWRRGRRCDAEPEWYRVEHRLPSLLVDGGIHLIEVIDMVSGTPLAPPLSVHLPLPGWLDHYGFSPDFRAQAVARAEQLAFTQVAPRDLAEAGGPDAFIAYCRDPELIRTDAAPPLEQRPEFDTPCHSYMTLGAYVASLPSAVLRPDRGLCYLPGARLWADSIYLTSTESIESDRARIAAGDSLRPVLPGLSLALTNCPYGNFFHWHLDCLGGLQLMVEQIGQAAATIVSGPLSPWQREGVARLAPAAQLVEVPPGELQPCERVLYPSYLAGRGIYPDQTVKAMFESLVAQNPPPSSYGRRLFFSRNDATHRKLRNEEALVATLSEYGFETVEPSQISYAEQIALAAGAEIIVGAHGAGLTNIGFAPPGTLVVELTASTYVNECFAHLSRLMGHRHVTLITPPADPDDRSAYADVGLVLDVLRRCGVEPV